MANRSFLLEEGDFALLDLSTAATRVNAEIVFVGYGICAPDKGLNEYEGQNVSLIKKGWTAEEIGSSRRGRWRGYGPRPRGIAGGNLSVLRP